MKNLCIAIVTYNASEYVNYFMSGLRDIELNDQIVVFDNDSEDDTLKLLSNFNNVHIIKSNSNIGFGKANNVIFKYALKSQYKYLFLLNQDAKIEYKDIKRLINNSIESPDYFLITPLHLTRDGKKLDANFCRSINGAFQLLNDLVLKRNTKSIYDIEGANAAGWLLPVTTIKKVGFFDEIFSHYGEDNDYCNRILARGGKIGININTYLFHDRAERIESKEKKAHKSYMGSIVVTINPNTSFFKKYFYSCFSLLFKSIKNPSLYFSYFVLFLMKGFQLYKKWKARYNWN